MSYEDCWGDYELYYNFVNVIERYLEDDESDVETFVHKYLEEGEKEEEC